MWDIPGLGIEPVSPALEGGFLSTAPPGKSHSLCFNAVYKPLLNVCKNTVNFFLMFICQSFLPLCMQRKKVIFMGRVVKYALKPVNVPLKAY